MVEFRAPLAADTVALEAGLRPADRAEIEAAAGAYTRSRRLAVIADAVAGSDEAWCAFAGDTLLAIFGVSSQSLLSFSASPWLLGTTALFTNRKALVAAPRPFIAAWAERYPRLENYVDARNVASIRWLGRMGFALDKAMPYGVEGRPFHRFFMENANVRAG